MKGRTDSASSNASWKGVELESDIDDESPLLRKRDTVSYIKAKFKSRTFWLSLLTWSRIKIVLVMLAFSLAIYLFTAETPIDPADLDINAASLSDPKIIPFDYYGFKPPIEVIEIDITTQKLLFKPPEPLFLKVAVERWNATLSVWQELDSTSLSLSTTTQNTLRKFFYIEEKPDLFSYQFNISTNSDVPKGFLFKPLHTSSYIRYQVVFAGFILLGVYILIIFELVHRTIAAMLGAFVALGILSNLHERPSLETIVGWIDFETCGLLFGMMIMVGIFSQTGFFEWTAVKAYKISKGKVWTLVTILCLFTCVVSAFLDNVTTILLIVPVTIKLCKVLDIPPPQIIISLVLFSNIGGTATIVGDPPNIIIVNSKQLQEFIQLDFFTFSLHMAPGVVLATIVAYFVIKKLVAKDMVRDPNVHAEGELEVWRRTLRKLPEDNEEERHVKEQLQRYIETQENSSFKLQNIAELEEKYRIRDVPLFVNSCLILSAVILLFFLHSAIHLNLSLAWIAIIGAISHLIISGIRFVFYRFESNLKSDVEEILEKVEFGTLLFFAALFILMKSLEDLQLIEWIGETTADIISGVPPGIGRECVAVVLLLWVSAIVSAFIDNIPFTAAMVPVVARLGSGDLGLPLTPLIWSLAFGTCFGGNGTLIGASANVVAAGLSESQGYPISFTKFGKIGMAVMVSTMMTATVYILVFHVFIPWY